MANKTRSVVLFEPIVIEGKDPVTEVTLRKPFSGELRGLSFSELMTMDVDTMMKLIPRISDLTERDMLNLDPVNYAPLFTEVAGFFVVLDSPTE